MFYFHVLKVIYFIESNLNVYKFDSRWLQYMQTWHENDI